MFVRAYLRASTKEQDASRAKAVLDAFAEDNGITIASYYIENESGASLSRPELFRLIEECRKGDVVLIEQVDRLSRLNFEDWEELKMQIKKRQIKVVSLDLPTSWSLFKTEDDTTSRILSSMNDMMLDTLAAVARKDYVDRRQRQAQGIAKAKMIGKYRGRPENQQRNQLIADLLQQGITWSKICEISGASRSTLSRVRKNYLV